jgi:hypothetical protein
MIVGDTIFVAVIAQINNNQVLAFVGAWAGMILTSIWWLLTSAGWSLAHRMLWKLGSNATDPGGPHYVYRKWCGEVWWPRFGDPIWFFAHLAIALFYVVYGAFAVYKAIGLLGSTLLVPLAVGLVALAGLIALWRCSTGKFSIQNSEEPAVSVPEASGGIGVVQHEHVHLRVHDVLTDKILVGRESARRLEDALKAMIAGVKTAADSPASSAVTVDFDGVEGMAPSFLDELVTIFESLIGSETADGKRNLIVANPPARLSPKFEAVARGHGMSVRALPDGSWILTDRRNGTP